MKKGGYLLRSVSAAVVVALVASCSTTVPADMRGSGQTSSAEAAAQTTPPIVAQTEPDQPTADLPSAPTTSRTTAAPEESPAAPEAAPPTSAEPAADTTPPAAEPAPQASSTAAARTESPAATQTESAAEAQAPAAPAPAAPAASLQTAEAAPAAAAMAPAEQAAQAQIEPAAQAAPAAPSEAEIAELAAKGESARAAADEGRSAALEAGAIELAPSRFAGAEEEYNQAAARLEAKDYAAAAELFGRAASTYGLAGRKAAAEALRKRIAAFGYAAYSPSYFAMGEAALGAEDESWKSGALSDLEEGIRNLDSAVGYYAFVAEKGPQYKSLEAKDAALAAKAAAAAERSELNAADEFSGAEAIMAEADAEHEKANYESSPPWYADAKAAYGAALDAALRRKEAAGKALEEAEALFASSEARAVQAGLGDNAYLGGARAALATVRAARDEKRYEDCRAAAGEVQPKAALSDELVAQKLRAEAAAAEAGKRLAWAEAVQLWTDHPAEYKEAGDTVKAASLACSGGKYLISAGLAEEVGVLLSDDFQARLTADRKAARAVKAGYSELAEVSRPGADAAKAAQAEAQVRLTWAESEGLAADYPAEYAAASQALRASYVAFETEAYDRSGQKAREASLILSDDFRAKVAAGRQAAADEAARRAAEKRAAEDAAAARAADEAAAARAAAADAAVGAAAKAAAEGAMADARRRAAWANENGIAADYSAEFRQGSGAMDDAYMAYGRADYSTASGRAAVVSSTFSDEFMARVAADRARMDADRRAAEDAAARASADAAARAAAEAAAEAAEKAAAEAAMADARRRIAWARENGIEADYPAEFGKGFGAMGGSDMAYGDGAYPTAAGQAKVVSAILSGEFMARVGSERRAAGDAAARRAAEEAAARAAAALAAAEAAMADAQRRMTWACENNISTDYPGEFKTGSTAMLGSYGAYGKEDYPAASGQAAIVSATFSDEFMAKQRTARASAKDAAARRAADEAAAKAAAAKKAADKAEAEAAMADARRRMTWARDNAIAADYPAEYGTASTGMSGAEAAFPKEQYPEATKDAGLVSVTLSDEFMARVAADRKAQQEAARKAAEKAGAEKAAAEKAAAERAAYAALPPPQVKVSVKPEFFSPDGDGENDSLNFRLEVQAPAGFADWKLEIFEASAESAKAGAAGRLFASWSGKGAPPATITWNGKSSRGELVESATNYNYRFAASDPRGKETAATGVVAVDVLVIRDGNLIKINVPSIAFRADYADFVGLDKEVVAKNESVVARVAQILNRFPGYKVTIQGHANSASKIAGESQAKIQAEETQELIPLSKARAEFVRAMLVRNRVDPNRLGVEGKGSSQPVVSFQDAENRWKNRRVEFVLVKK